uniref:Uncharacterized protein n=1 Tax=Gopherus agassizii TaxID=38772 RepID=A0A452I947_9SAUR
SRRSHSSSLPMTYNGHPALIQPHLQPGPQSQPPPPAWDQLSIPPLPSKKAASPASNPLPLSVSPLPTWEPQPRSWPRLLGEDMGRDKGEQDPEKFGTTDLGGSKLAECSLDIP